MNSQYYPLILQALGHLTLLSIMAIAFLIATRRTSLLGFRLLFYFAAGQLLLALPGALALMLIANFFAIHTVAYAAYAKSILGLALYALALVGVVSLLRNNKTRNA